MSGIQLSPQVIFRRSRERTPTNESISNFVRAFTTYRPHAMSTPPMKALFLSATRNLCCMALCSFLVHQLSAISLLLSTSRLLGLISHRSITSLPSTIPSPSPPLFFFFFFFVSFLLGLLLFRFSSLRPYFWWWDHIKGVTGGCRNTLMLECIFYSPQEINT